MNLFLDFDGTIVDPAARYHAVYVRSLAAVSDRAEAPIPADRYWNYKRERMPERDILARHHGAVDVDAYHRERMALIEHDEMLALDPMLPRARQALDALSEVAPLYVVTMRKNRDSLMAQLAGLGITELFTRVLSRHGGDRPHEVKVDLMRDIAGPGDWIAGDTEADVNAGKLLGLTTCATTSGIRTEEFLRSLYPDHVIDGLGALVRLL